MFGNVFRKMQLLFCLLISPNFITTQTINEEFFPESNCIKTTFSTLFPTQSASGAGHFSLDPIKNLVLLLSDLTRVSLQRLNLKVATPKDMKAVQFVRSRNWYSAISLGDILDIAAEWHQNYSKELGANNRAITSFMLCQDQDTAVCNLGNASYFSRSECDVSVEHMARLYSIAKPKVPSGISLAIDGDQRIKFATINELDENTEKYYFVAKETETSRVYFQVLEDIKEYTQHLVEILKVFDSKLSDIPEDPCIESSLTFSMLLKTTLVNQDDLQRVCEAVQERSSLPQASQDGLPQANSDRR